MNTAAKAHCNKFHSKTFLYFVHNNELDIKRGLSELPDLLLINGLTVRRVHRQNHCPGLPVHILSIMRFPVSSDNKCHPLQHFNLTQGIQMFFSFAVANLSRAGSIIQLCSTLSHMLAILHQKARTVNGIMSNNTPVTIQSCDWLAKTAWFKGIQAIEDLLDIPEHNGRLFKLRQTPASFAGVFCLLWNTSVSLQSSLVQGVLSASIRSCVKLSGHLPLALKHEGERFSDHSEKQLTEAPSLLL